MIDVEVDGALTELTLSRPERRNALGPAALAELSDAVADVSTPVAYLHGAGSAFCAGADLSVVEDLDRAGARRLARDGQRVCRQIERSDAVVVAGVDGPARGGGVELALACDLRVATPDATFAETGVRLGLFGAWGGTVRLPDQVGKADAFDLALSGRVVDAEQALAMGLVSRVTAEPRAVAAEVADNDPAALRAIKRRLRDDDHRAARERREAEAFADLVGRRDDGSDAGQ